MMLRAAVLSCLLAGAATAQDMPRFDSDAAFDVQLMAGSGKVIVGQDGRQFLCVWNDTPFRSDGTQKQADFVEVVNCAPVIAGVVPEQTASIGLVTDTFIGETLIKEASDEVVAEGFVASMRAYDCVLDLQSYERNRDAFVAPLLDRLGISADLANDLRYEIDTRLEDILVYMGDDVVMDSQTQQLRLARGCR